MNTLYTIRMFEAFTANPDAFEKKIESLSEGVHKYARDFDPAEVRGWCESDSELMHAYESFMGASEVYANYVCMLDELMKNGGDANEILLKQSEAHTNSENSLKFFIESAHKKGHLQELSGGDMPRSKTAQLALFSAFTNAYEETKMNVMRRSA